MLHVRRVAIPSLLAETSPFAVWLRGRPDGAAIGRAVGDRAINRGEVSRQMMRENYLRILDKCKCEYLSNGHADTCVVLVHRTLVPLARTRVRAADRTTRAHRALSTSSMSRLRGLDTRRMRAALDPFDISKARP